jgi:hypothetical protein
MSLVTFLSIKIPENQNYINLYKAKYSKLSIFQSESGHKRLSFLGNSAEDDVPTDHDKSALI